MAYSTHEVVSDGTLVLLDIAIEYFDREDITVYFDGVPNAYPWEWVGPITQRTISFTPAVLNGVVVLVRRNTDISQPRHIFSLGAQFTTQSMDEDLRQVLQIAQEAKEGGWGESTSELREDLALPSGGTLVGHDPATGGNTSVSTELLAHEAQLEALPTPTGSSGVGFIQSGTGAVAMTVQSKLRESVSVKDFGAKGDGVTDDTAAINNWLAMLSMGIAIEAPEGRFKFTSALSIPALDNISIKGSGRQKTTFVYAGASTTNDIITIGDGITSFTGLSLEGFNIDSTTTMTAGTALRIKKQQNGGTNINGISFSVLNAPKKLWDGIWFDNTNVTTYKGFEINVQNEAIIVNGIAGADSGSDLYLDDGTITFASVGVHCAGGFGGLYLGQILFFGNLTHLKVDNGRVARFNREIILSDLSIFDGCKDYGVYVNDPLASGCNLTINASIGSAGRIGPGGAGNNIAIISYPNSRITIGSGQIFNATQNGIWIGDATTIVNIGSATQITNNGAYGIYGNVSTNLVNYQCTFSANTLGDVQGNVRPTFQYTPVVLASSGTITSSTGVVNYHRVGNRVWFDAYLNITNNGTGSGVIICSLPTQIRQAACAAGYTNGVTYQGVFAQLPSNQAYMQITYESGTYPGATGQTIVVSGSYETY